MQNDCAAPCNTTTKHPRFARAHRGASMRASAAAVSLVLSISSALPATLVAEEQPIGVTQLPHFRKLPNGLPFPNPSGSAAPFSPAGHIDLTGEFFQDLGGNGRRCVSCHLPTAGWTITPPQIRAVFEKSQGGVIPDALGLSAIFRTNDGSNSPNADVSSLAARRRAYSMLLK